MKERLVGAAVLVAIGAWLIPWVLDGPENPVDTRASSLQLPPAEEPMPMRTQTLRLGGPEETTPAESGAANSAAAEAKPVVAAAAPTEPPATPVPASPPAVEPPQPKATAAPAPAPAAVAKGDWVVQLGSFGDEANARRLAQRVSTFGYRADITSHRSGGRTLYRVRVGPIESRSQAEATASALTAHGLVAQVVAAD